jgi:hypothetical protein
MIFATIIEWRTHLPRPVPRAHPPIPRPPTHPAPCRPTEPRRRLPTPNPALRPGQTHRRTDPTVADRPPVALLHVLPRGRHGPRPGAMPLLSSPLAAETVLAPLFYSAPPPPLVPSRPLARRPTPAAYPHVRPSPRANARD